MRPTGSATPLHGFWSRSTASRGSTWTTCSASRSRSRWWRRTPASSWPACPPTTCCCGAPAAPASRRWCGPCCSATPPQGLRVIQVDKDDLVHLPDIVDRLKGEPYRFILFSDDVSFETGESSYKMLKSALDGSVYAPPENVLIYVTSNRRHLLPEYESDNRGAMLVERRDPPWRGGGGEDFALRPLRPVGRLSSLQPGPVPGGGPAVGRKARPSAALPQSRGMRPASRRPSSGRRKRATAAAASPTSSPTNWVGQYLLNSRTLKD